MVKSCELLKEQEIEIKKPKQKLLGLRGLIMELIVACFLWH